MGLRASRTLRLRAGNDKMNSPVEPVIAGSRGFALALLAPLTERIGTRPRIAADAARARAFCSGPAGLVVVEFLGGDTLQAIRELLLEGKGVRVVAAVPEKHASADAPLRALGVDVARWDGTATAIVAAVGRQLDASAAGAHPGATTSASAPPTPAPRAPTAASAAVAASAPPVAQRTSVPSVAAELAWPAMVPSQADATDALDRAIAGLTPPVAVVAGVIAALSDVERVVLAGGAVGVDPEPLRQAAAMRVRVAAALATVPTAGGAVDGAAVSALLAEIDALLSQVSAVAAGAPPEIQPSLEAVRNGLVSEAIDFSEAVQRVSPAGEGAEAVARHVPLRRAQTRIISLDATPPKTRGRAVGAWIALAVAALLAGSYHGWNWYQRRTIRAALATGLPAGLTQIPGPPGGPRVIVRATTTEAPNAADVARFKAAEEAKGNKVRESDGMIFIEPARPDRAPAEAPGKF